MVDEGVVGGASSRVGDGDMGARAWGCWWARVRGCGVHAQIPVVNLLSFGTGNLDPSV